jgi:signal transduction histidine kinase
MGEILSHSPEKEGEVVDLAMLSNFVHQIVNPLNGIAGTLDNLLNGEIEERRRPQRLGAARAQIEQCITLLHNLAFLSQGFGRVLDAELEIITLPKIIIDSAMFYQEEGRQRGVEISLSDPLTKNKVRAQPNLIRQVLMNIFDNCVKYGEAGSTVVVDQRIQKKTGLALIVIKSRSKFPINTLDIKKLTNLGFRGDNARKTVASGTGLGLYICKHIIEDTHSGVFTIQARHSNELEFTLRLPHGQAG